MIVIISNKREIRPLWQGLPFSLKQDSIIISNTIFVPIAMAETLEYKNSNEFTLGRITTDVSKNHRKFIKHIMHPITQRIIVNTLTVVPEKTSEFVIFVRSAMCI